jgi:sialate O-acetylesterase
MIRQFKVPIRYCFTAPLDDLDSGRWESANPTSVLWFSAVGYFFAESLFEQYHVPIGLINASLGGSPAESWMSEEALKAYPRHLETAQEFKNAAYADSIRKADQERADAWYRLLWRTDKGLHDNVKWFDPAYDDSAWPAMTVPAFWAEGGLGPVNGAVWFRKDFEVPASMTGQPARLLLGRIVDADSVFINGRFVGWTSYQYPQRDYLVSGDILKPGKNTIIVRVINLKDKGGFVKDKPYRLTAGGQIIDLSGEWRYRLGATMEPLTDPTFIQWQPTGLYNGMLAPLLNCSIKGVIWYQGESNTGRGKEYEKLFPDLIADWRRSWQRGDFSFLFVQLPNFLESKPEPSESGWAELREAQLKALAVPNTGMAVAIDLGEWNDVHPLNKEDVGKRLALTARKTAYGEKDLVVSGPLFQSTRTEGDQLMLTFSNIGGGLVVKGGGELKHFAIAGPDHQFVWAKAKIDGDRVVVWSDRVSHPVFVRYAWADNPDGANLYNREGLPASPFRAGD